MANLRFWAFFYRKNHISLNSCKGLALLDLGSTVLLQPDSLDGNESSGVLGAEALEGVHAGLLLAVQVALGCGSGENVGGSLVDHHVHGTGNVLLAELDGVLCWGNQRKPSFCFG